MNIIAQMYTSLGLDCLKEGEEVFLLSSWRRWLSDGFLSTSINAKSFVDVPLALFPAAVEAVLSRNAGSVISLME